MFKIAYNNEYLKTIYSKYFTGIYNVYTIMVIISFFKVYARGIHSRLFHHIPRRIRTSTWSMLLEVFPYNFCELLFCSSWFVVMVVRFLSSLNISSRVLCQGIKFCSNRCSNRCSIILRRPHSEALTMGFLMAAFHGHRK